MPNLYWCEKGRERDYRVAHSFTWEIGKKGSGYFFTVQKGVEFESSVPALLHWFLSPEDPYFIKAAAVHDQLLESGYRYAFADSQWYEVALSEQASPTRARLAYVAMRTRRLFLWIKSSEHKK
jgi:hypothetical protein